jgi:hypothetical protein
MARSTSFLFLIGALALAAAAIFACGGGDNTTTTPTTTTATTTTTTTLWSAGLSCSPTPPPLYGIGIKVHAGDGTRNVLDSRPVVWDTDDYCERTGQGSGYFCYARVEGDPQAPDCDRMAVGRAQNGNWGPTWFWESRLCPTDTNPGCSDYPAGNQFMLIAKGPGTYEACAAANIPLSSDPEKPGSRCGRCLIRPGSSTCE